MNLLAAILLSPFFFDLTSDLRTAYVTRAKVVEDRPMQINHLRTGWDTGAFGRIGFRAWIVSSLTDSRQGVHRRAFNESDPGVFWNYALALDEASEWRLTTEVLKNWIILNGYTRTYRAKGSDDTIDEWRLGNALENPYVTPYWLLRRGIREKDWTYYQVGLRRRFPLTKTLSLTLDYQVELGNRRHLLVRYGKFGDGSDYSSGIQSSVFRAQLGWQATEGCELFAAVCQFDLLSSKARDACADHNACCGRADLTYGSVGVRFRF